MYFARSHQFYSIASWYFGERCLPIIEAFGFGAPVITSDINPMREIAGDAAVLVSPFCIDAIADAMVSLLSNPKLSAELVRKGKRRLVDFNKAKIAGEQIDTYRDALGLA